MLAAVSAGFAETIALIDTEGKALGNLPCVSRGDESFVPLAMLARAGEWNLESSEGRHSVTSPTLNVELYLGRLFAKSGERVVQLRLPPEEWDGSLWIPLVNLTDLFPEIVEFQRGGKQISLKLPVKEQPKDTAAVQAAEPKAEKWELRTVIVDPGHGGKDPGAKGLNNLIEKEVTLDIARRLGSLLEKRGLTAALTRVSDHFVSLQDRTHFANQKKGDLFVSIHCNSARDPQIRGVEAYFLKPARTQRAIDAAMRENSVVKLENGDSKYQDLTQDNYILLTMATSQYMKDSETWASQVVRLTSSATGSDARGVDQAGFYVLMGASMPAVLVEVGYISNAEDARMLSSERGRQKTAEALLESILKMKLNLEGSAAR